MFSPAIFDLTIRKRLVIPAMSEAKRRIEKSEKTLNDAFVLFSCVWAEPEKDRPGMVTCVL